MPANSLTVSPALAMNRSTIAAAPLRSGNCSRINAPSPWPVYAPSRAHISCTTTSATVIRTMRNSIR